MLHTFACCVFFEICIQTEDAVLHTNTENPLTTNFQLTSMNSRWIQRELSIPNGSWVNTLSMMVVETAFVVSECVSVVCVHRHHLSYSSFLFIRIEVNWSLVRFVCKCNSCRKVHTCSAGKHKIQVEKMQIHSLLFLSRFRFYKKKDLHHDNSWINVTETFKKNAMLLSVCFIFLLNWKSTLQRQKTSL